MATIDVIARSLKSDALRQKGRIAKRHLGAFNVMLSFQACNASLHPGEQLPPGQIPADPHEHWHFSAKLQQDGSTTHDWAELGVLMAALAIPLGVTARDGAPEAYMVLDPYTTEPAPEATDVHHWAWVVRTEVGTVHAH